MNAFSFQVMRLGLALLLPAVGYGCGAGRPRQDDPPSEVSSASRRPEDVLGPEQRFRMPVEGLACEGPEDPLITVVEYFGYQCPFTRRLEPTVRQLLSEHEGSVRFCVRHYVIPADQPFGMLAAQAAIETFRQRGGPAFFRLHRAMLDAELDEPRIIALAVEAGADETELREALTSGRHEATIAAGQASLGRLDRSGTPTLYIAGRLLAGARPHAEVAAVFDDAIEEARQLLSVGVPRSELYETVQRGAVDSVTPQRPRPGEPARVRIRFIDVPTGRHPLAVEQRTLAEARAIAETVAEEIRSGADFGALARRWSAASNAARGGEFGWVARGTLTEDTEDVAMALQLGEVGISCGAAGLACRVVQRVE